MPSFTDHEFIGSLMKYANSTKCACTACRALRERNVEILEEKVAALQKQLRANKK